MADAAETISAWRLRTPTMGQIERHLTSEEFRQLESRLPEIVRRALREMQAAAELQSRLRKR